LALLAPARSHSSTFGAFLTERIPAPLQMAETAFHTVAENAGRLAEPFAAGRWTGEKVQLFNVGLWSCRRFVMQLVPAPKQRRPILLGSDARAFTDVSGRRCHAIAAGPTGLVHRSVPARYQRFDSRHAQA